MEERRRYFDFNFDCNDCLRTPSPVKVHLLVRSLARRKRLWFTANSWGIGQVVRGMASEGVRQHRAVLSCFISMAYSCNPRRWRGLGAGKSLSRITEVYLEIPECFPACRLAVINKCWVNFAPGMGARLPGQEFV